MTTKRFFEESKQQSQIKSAIVSKYFGAWAKVMIGVQNKNRQRDTRIAYIDLFAGPGRYEDGTISTPLLVLKKAIQDTDLRQCLVTIFNDKDETNKNSLQKAFDELSGIESLKYPPKVFSREVGQEIDMMFKNIRLIPTLFFIDPWGYKGLSLHLVGSVIKGWGCDCIFFFNYNRINMGLNNEVVRKHMNVLFGVERANDLQKKLELLDPNERELTIVEELCQALRDLGPKYVLPFRFKDDHGSRTRHHLIFVSKAFKGYEIMKDIMASESSNAEQGIASFEYNPVDTQIANQQLLLFQLSRPLDELGEMLLNTFSGQTLEMIKIYKLHNVDRPYIKKNYKRVLIQLEEQRKIFTSKHKAGTLGDRVQVTFPEREENSHE